MSNTTDATGKVSDLGLDQVPTGIDPTEKLSDVTADQAEALIEEGLDEAEAGKGPLAGAAS